MGEGSNGVDGEHLREVIRIRKQDKSKREEFEAVLELYLNALGDFVETDLGRASMPKRGVA